MVKKEYVLVYDKMLSVLIGENAKENSMLIKENHPNDLWFHLAKTSSPHIILQCNGYSIPPSIIIEIAGLLYKYKKNADPQDVIYTEIKNVKLTKTPGLVIPHSLNTVKYKKIKLTFCD